MKPAEAQAGEEEAGVEEEAAGVKVLALAAAAEELMVTNYRTCTLQGTLTQLEIYYGGTTS